MTPCSLKSCIGRHCLGYVWVSRTYHPERRGQRCCVLQMPPGYFTDYIQVRFEDGLIVSQMPKGAAKQLPRSSYDRSYR